MFAFFFLGKRISSSLPLLASPETKEISNNQEENGLFSTFVPPARQTQPICYWQRRSPLLASKMGGHERQDSKHNK